MATFNLNADDVDAIATSVVEKISEQTPPASSNQRSTESLARQYYSESEVAESFGVSLDYLKKLRQRGQVSCARPVRPVGYSHSDIDRLRTFLNDPHRGSP